MNDLGFNDILPDGWRTDGVVSHPLNVAKRMPASGEILWLGKFNIQGAQGVSGLLRFLRDVGRLKKTPRTGWIEAGIARPESVADHSFRTAVMSMVLADMHGLDAEKAMRMALLHDLPESITGDLTPRQKASRGAALRREEEEAVDEMLSNLPGSLSEKYRSIWAEYREGLSPEARAVIESDRTEMLIQVLEYEDDGADASRLRHFWDATIEDPILFELMRPEIRKRGGKG